MHAHDSPKDGRNKNDDAQHHEGFGKIVPRYAFCGRCLSFVSRTFSHKNESPSKTGDNFATALSLCESGTRKPAIEHMRCTSPSSQCLRNRQPCQELVGEEPRAGYPHGTNGSLHVVHISNPAETGKPAWRFAARNRKSLVCQRGEKLQGHARSRMPVPNECVIGDLVLFRFVSSALEENRCQAAQH
jgi:hypothetical protein